MGADGEEVDFLAQPLADVQVTALNPAREDGLVPGTFQISRTRALDSPLRVLFHLGGTAEAGADYLDWPNKVSQTNIFQVLNGTVTNLVEFDYVDLPVGAASTNISITLRIQTVSISEIGIVANTYPLYTVTASITKFSLRLLARRAIALEAAEMLAVQELAQ